MVRGVAAAVAVATAGSMLGASARDVGDALAAGDLAEARRLLPTLVGRDPGGLDEADISRAVVESVAENCVDAVVAPAVLGAGGRRPRCGRSPRRQHPRRDGRPPLAPATTASAGPAPASTTSPRGCRPDWPRWRWPRSGPLGPAPSGGRSATRRRPTRRPTAVSWRPRSRRALGVTLGGRNRYGERVEDRPLLGDGASGRAPGHRAGRRAARPRDGGDRAGGRGRGAPGHSSKLP